LEYDTKTQATKAKMDEWVCIKLKSKPEKMIYGKGENIL
jgi:hypothetical protein